LKNKIEQITYRVLLFFPLLILVFGSLGTIQSENNTFSINKMIFNGCNLNKKSDLHDLYWSHYGNKSIFSINKEEVRNKLLGNEFIADVNIIKLLPNTIVFDIIEISPIGKIQLNNHNIIVDDRKSKFVLSSNIQSERFDIPEIIFDSSLNEDKIFDRVEYKFLNYIFSKYPKLYNKIEEIKKSDEHLLIKVKDCFIKFSSLHYLNKNELENLSILINNNKIDFDSKNYEYIKFTFEEIIVKERDFN